MSDASHWIHRLGLAPHPEGGWFRETYRAAESIPRAGLPARFPGPRALSTAIYFLLEHPDCSRLHRIRSDELWHFHAGATLTVVGIDPRGALCTQRLGVGADPNVAPQAVVRAGWWFGAFLEEPGSFALVGCTVAPGFDFADLELAARAPLVERHPQHRALIERLTR